MYAKHLVCNGLTVPVVQYLLSRLKDICITRNYSDSFIDTSCSNTASISQILTNQFAFGNSGPSSGEALQLGSTDVSLLTNYEAASPPFIFTDAAAHCQSLHSKTVKIKVKTAEEGTSSASMNPPFGTMAHLFGSRIAAAPLSHPEAVKINDKDIEKGSAGMSSTAPFGAAEQEGGCLVSKRQPPNQSPQAKVVLTSNSLVALRPIHRFHLETMNRSIYLCPLSLLLDQIHLRLVMAARHL
jgi:hypothetical protein